MRTAASSFTDLEVWQKSHAFVMSVYSQTSTFPHEERFGFCVQFRRAAISIPANIAEGFRKYTARDKARFFNTAQGSLEECRYYCILARDLGYADTTALLRLVDEISPLLKAYISRLRATQAVRYGAALALLIVSFF